jgi:hypothetical protein
MYSLHGFKYLNNLEKKGYIKQAKLKDRYHNHRIIKVLPKGMKEHADDDAGK